jgi:hypothetical protein
LELLGLFDKYFLILVLIHGLILIITDSRRYKNQGEEGLAKKARLVGSTVCIISIGLFVIASIAM